MQVFLNYEELEKLYGQIPELWQFYVVLKKFMDYRNGIVGQARGISWQSLQEEMYIEPGQGLTGTGTPAKSKIRRLAERAEKAGLIEDRSAPKRLIFFMPLATTDQSAQKKPGTNPAQTRHVKADTPESSKDAPFEAKKENPGTVADGVFIDFSEKPGTPPLSGNPVEERGAKAPVEFAAGELDGQAKPPARSGKRTNPLKASNGTADAAVREVFDYWRAVHNHPRAQLDSQRRTKIAARLKDGYSVDDLKRAIDGCKASPFHQGKNDDGRVWDDIELICRSASKVEQFKKYVAQVKRHDDELEAWLNEGRDEHVIEGEFSYVG